MMLWQCMDISGSVLKHTKGHLGYHWTLSVESYTAGMMLIYKIHILIYM